MFFILLFVVLLAISPSCSKEATAPNTPTTAVETHRCYIKYVISTEYSQAQAQVRDEKGTLVRVKGNGEYVFGPVAKGFVAQVITSNANRTTSVVIQVSIDSEPFAIKAFKEHIVKI